MRPCCGMRSSGFAERQIKRNDSCFLPYLTTAGSTESVWKSFLKIKKLCGLMTIFPVFFFPRTCNYTQIHRNPKLHFVRKCNAALLFGSFLQLSKGNRYIIYDMEEAAFRRRGPPLKNQFSKARPMCTKFMFKRRKRLWLTHTLDALFSRRICTQHF